MTDTPTWRDLEETLRSPGIDTRGRRRERNWRTYTWWPTDDPRRVVHVSITRRPAYSTLDVDWFGWAEESPAWFQEWVRVTVCPYVRRAYLRRRSGGTIPSGRTCIVADVLTVELPELLDVLLPKLGGMLRELAPFDDRAVS